MMIVSQSRAAAADTRHRIDYPNSRPRALTVIGLGEGGARIVRRLNDWKFQHVQVLTPPAGHTGQNPSDSPAAMFRAIAAEGQRLGQALESADMIFMVATPADDLSVAAEIGQLGRQRRILITGILVQPTTIADAQTESALERLRAATDMLVVVSDFSYVIEMLSELGARATAELIQAQAKLS